MKLLIFFAFSFAILFVEQAQSQSITNWGTAKYGVQLAITVSNDIIAADSTIPLRCYITNGSTNVESFELKNPGEMFEVSLLGSPGKQYPLTPGPPNKLGWGRHDNIHKLLPGEVYEWIIPARVDKVVESGNYELKAVGDIMWRSEKHDGYGLVSNVLKVRIR
jgi:hypothetical protein